MKKQENLGGAESEWTKYGKRSSDTGLAHSGRCPMQVPSNSTVKDGHDETKEETYRLVHIDEMRLGKNR